MKILSIDTRAAISNLWDELDDQISVPLRHDFANAFFDDNLTGGALEAREEEVYDEVYSIFRRYSLDLSVSNLARVLDFLSHQTTYEIIRDNFNQALSGVRSFGLNAVNLPVGSDDDPVNKPFVEELFEEISPRYKYDVEHLGLEDTPFGHRSRIYSVEYYLRDGLYARYLRESI